MSEREEREALRRAAEEASPEWAAAVAAREFEKRAIVLPTQLLADPGAPPQQRRLLEVAGSMWRELVMAGPEGLTLFALDAKVFRSPGSPIAAEAIRALRESGTVQETTYGSGADQVWLRAARRE